MPPENELKIISYNVRGMKNKIKQIDFFQYLLEFNIIFLSETHVEEGSEKMFQK